MKRGEVTMMVLADFSKAFDTVPFGELITKMNNLGLSKNFLILMLDYVSNRRQFVQIDDNQSEVIDVKFGILQGTAGVENKTFQDNASKLFNSLPIHIRNCKNFNTSSKLAKEFLIKQM